MYKLTTSIANIIRPATLVPLALMLLIQTAHAIPIQVTTIAADWHSVTRGGNLEFIDADGITGAEELRWGGNVSTVQKSGYLFEGVGTGYNIQNVAMITLGYFTHINQTILPGTSIRTASLNLLTQFVLPGFDAFTLPVDIGLRHRETTNACTSSPDCANDLVTLDFAPIAPLTIGNHRYVLDEIGFVPGSHIQNQFSTVEETDNLTPLVGRLVRTPIPTPGTLGLVFAAGLGMLFMRTPASSVAPPMTSIGKKRIF